MYTKGKRAESALRLPICHSCTHICTRSPGYALTLLAESTTGAMHCAEAISKPGVAPEDIALTAARALLSEIKKGGVVDRQHQSLVLMMMVLGSEDVGRCRMGEPTARTCVLPLTHAFANLTADFQNTTSARHQGMFWHRVQDHVGRAKRSRIRGTCTFLLWYWLREREQVISITIRRPSVYPRVCVVKRYLYTCISKYNEILLPICR